MTSAVDEYYIHYHAKNIPSSVMSTFETANKTELLKDQLRQFQIRKIDKRMDLSKYLGSYIDTGQLLDGTLLQGISNMSFQGTASLGPLDFSQASQAQIMSILNTDIQEINTLADCQKAVDNFLNTLPTAAQQSIQSYATDTIKMLAQNHGISSGMGSQTSNMIIRSILSRSDEKCFRIEQEEGKPPVYESVINKLGALAKALPNKGYGSINNDTKMTVKHSSDSDKKGKKVIGEQAIAQELMRKIQGYMQYLNTRLYEVSHGLSKLKIDKHFANWLEEVGGHFRHTGSDSCAVDWTPSGDMQEFLSCSKNATDMIAHMTQNKTYKSDFGIYLGEDKTEGFMGFNAKNYKASFDPSLNAVDYVIQSGTPMLTLMIREAHFSTTQVYHAIQIGAAVRVNNEGPQLNGLWDNFITQLRYRALLSAIAGLPQSVDQSFYMVLGGRFFLMDDILNNLIQTVQSGNAEAVYMNELAKKGSSTPGGLQRDKYVQINKRNWQKDTGDDQDSRTRSQLVIGDSLDLMYKTKLSVSIHLSELAALNNLAL